MLAKPSATGEKLQPNRISGTVFLDIGMREITGIGMRVQAAIHDAETMRVSPSQIIKDSRQLVCSIRAAIRPGRGKNKRRLLKRSRMRSGYGLCCGFPSAETTQGVQRRLVARCSTDPAFYSPAEP